MWCEKLYDEQTEALEFLLQLLRHSGGAGLFSEQGTGKTIITLALLERLAFQIILIIAPLTSLDVTWAERLAPTHDVHRSLESLLEALKRNAGGDTPSKNKRPQALLIHPEGLPKIRSRLKRRLAMWDLIVWDESQRTKQRGSLSSRIAKQLNKARRRLMLSGTPIDEEPIDIWAQMRFIEPKVFGETWAPFADKYCHRTGYMGYEWGFRFAKLPQFLDQIKPYIFRLTKSFLNLPPVLVHPTPVSLLGNQRRIYEEMDHHGCVTIDGTRFKADLAVVKNVRLAQITGGFIQGGRGRRKVTATVGRAKVRKLTALLPRLKLPIVVFCKFLPEFDAVLDVGRQQFDRYACLRGSVDRDERTRILRAFQAGDIDFLVCQIRTGGVSIELSRSCQIIGYSINYSQIDFEQFVSRLHRKGQTETVDLWLLYAKNTVDEAIIDTIERKRSNVYRVMQPLER